MTTLFISGIDTEIGKTFACGLLAKSLLDHRYHVFTQKWVETGCHDGPSQDLLTHQRLVGTAFNSNREELHSPYRYAYPASPHLSAEREGSSIDCGFLATQTKELEARCEHLLIEGAGGLCVPLNQHSVTIDLVAELKLPIILVTSGRLGSINHTLLSLEACAQRDIEVRAIIYNHYPNQESIISTDTRVYLQNYLTKRNMSTMWFELPVDARQLDISSAQSKQLLGIQ